MNYVDQLNTLDWKLKSHEIKKRDNFTCQICGKRTDLHTHHVVYEPDLKAWEYPNNYYITLCDICHLYEHSFIDNTDLKIKSMLLSGLMGIDIYRKLKNKEPLIFNDK